MIIFNCNKFEKFKIFHKENRTLRKLKQKLIFTMSKSRSGFDSFSVAEQLIYGSPIDIVPEKEIQTVIGALCSLRNESFTVNPSKERVNKINSIIAELQSYIGMPKEKKGRKIKSYSSKISQSKQTESPLTQEDIDNLNDMIDNALEGDEIIPENETQRKTLISMLKERKEDEIKASNYYKVERIDEVIKDLQPVRIVNDEFLRYRLSQLTKRLELINQKRDQINEERKSTFRDLNEEQDSQYQDLLSTQKQEMNTFCQTLPQFDDPRNMKFSSKLLTMRENEKNFARGGDYDGATKLHQEADILEEKERHDAVYRVIRTCNLKRSQEKKKQKLKRQCFVERWNQKFDDQNADYDRTLAVLKLQGDSIESQIKSIEKKLGIGSSNSRTIKGNSTRY